MEDYDLYKIGRDMSWEALLEAGIDELPVQLDRVAKVYKIQVISYDKAIKLGMMNDKRANGKMFTSVIKGVKTVFVNNNIKDKGEVRYLIAVGIGRCILAKNPNFITKEVDYETKIFARDLLMPATVLHGLGVSSAADIAVLCNVSWKKAVSRETRMKELKDRGMFNQHPLEEKVYMLFENFIDSRKK